MNNDPRNASTQNPDPQPQQPGEYPGTRTPGTQTPDRHSADPQVRPYGIESPAKPPMQEFPGKPQRDMPMPDRERASGVQQVEGEGSYTASRNYRDGLERSVQQGNTERLADDAAEALDGPEGQELRQAEQQGKQGRPLTGKPEGTGQSSPQSGRTPAQRQSQPTSHR